MWASKTVKNSTNHSNLLQNYLQPFTKLARILCSPILFVDVTIEQPFIKSKYISITMKYKVMQFSFYSICLCFLTWSLLSLKKMVYNLLLTVRVNL